LNGFDGLHIMRRISKIVVCAIVVDKSN